METLWRACPASASIRRYAILETTRATVTYAAPGHDPDTGARVTEKRVSHYAAWFEDWRDARAWLMRDAQARQKRAQAALDSAKARVRRVADLKKCSASS